MGESAEGAKTVLMFINTNNGSIGSGFGSGELS
jgi:hypothetical protein